MPGPSPPDASGAEHDLPYRDELKRKALHLLALVVPLSMAWLGRRWSLYVLLPAALLALTGDVLRARNAPFARFIHRLFGFMMRQEEVPPVGGPIIINGATWVLTSAALLAIFFPLRLAVPAFTMFMVADAAAALIGRRIGQIHWRGTSRTVEGSAGFLVAGGAVIAFFPLPYWIGALGVLAGALAEAAPRPFNDNIRVPFVATLVMFLLERLVTLPLVLLLTTA